MHRRNTGGASAGGGEPLAAQPPASPEGAAVAASDAARAPNPPPPATTSKGALESSTGFLPAPLQPVGMLLVGLGKALWAFIVPLARIAYRLAIWCSPLLIWAGTKYIKWYFLAPFFAWIDKATRIVSWSRWLLSFFFKSGGAAAA
ncbi:hypothetical protein ABPG75_006973 [Micractinium tetrahymenae]